MPRASTTKPYCAPCDKSFSRKYEYTRHMRRHADNVDDLKFPCPHAPSCNYKALQRSNLKTHVRAVHLGLKDCLCRVCPSGFGDDASRIRHERKIHGLEPKTRSAATSSRSNAAATESELASPSLSSSSSSEDCNELSLPTPTTETKALPVALDAFQFPAPSTDVKKELFPIPDHTVPPANSLQDLLLNAYFEGYCSIETQTQPVSQPQITPSPAAPSQTSTFNSWDPNFYNAFDSAASSSSSSPSSTQASPTYDMTAFQLPVDAYNANNAHAHLDSNHNIANDFVHPPFTGTQAPTLPFDVGSFNVGYGVHSGAFMQHALDPWAVPMATAGHAGLGTAIMVASGVVPSSMYAHHPNAIDFQTQAWAYSSGVGMY